MFSHKRYMNGAATNPDAHVFAYAAAQTKKVRPRSLWDDLIVTPCTHPLVGRFVGCGAMQMMDVTLKLGGECFVFWGGREGYQSLLNTNVKRELDHLGQ